MPSNRRITQLNSIQKKISDLSNNVQRQTCHTEWNKPDNLFNVVQPLFSTLKANKQNPSKT